jgi:predicted nucleotidyltransferase
MDDVIEAQLNTITDTIVNTVPVNQIYLFGSYAYGTPKDDSDLDLYVIVPDNTGREIDIAIDIKKAIRKRELMPVDLLVSTISRFNDRITAPTLERRVHEQGRLVYG